MTNHDPHCVAHPHSTYSYIATTPEDDARIRPNKETIMHYVNAEDDNRRGGSQPSPQHYLTGCNLTETIVGYLKCAGWLANEHLGRPDANMGT